ncbi:MAG: hypothetical protein EON93_22510 [Burkholderiales bacterium]|nr:MAG: hypothetical protein EON93_22510 [Burkholderiales bacterium]
MIILDLATRASMIHMAQRKNGLAAKLFRALESDWMDGAYASEIVDVLAELELPVHVEWVSGFDSGVDGFAADALKRGRLVLLAYESERTSRHRHWVLGVGCSGESQDRKLAVDTLLALDPSTDSLPFTVCNCAFSVSKPVDFGLRLKSVVWKLDSVDDVENVRLMSAISLTPRIHHRRHR